MPDLAITVEKRGGRSLRGVAHARVQTARRECRPGRDNPHRGAALPDPDRSDAPPLHAREQERLRDLFGEPERWGQTLRNLLWTNTSVGGPAIHGRHHVDLQVPCTFDFSVATTKYFNGLADGEIPVCLMFSGTVFYADAARRPASRADFLGQRNEIPPAAAGLERHDGRVLSQQRVAVPAQGRLRGIASASRSSAAFRRGSRHCEICWLFEEEDGARHEH